MSGGIASPQWNACVGGEARRRPSSYAKVLTSSLGRRRRFDDANALVTQTFPFVVGGPLNRR